MLCPKDSDFIPSVTFLTGARGLLVGALKAICFPGTTCLVPSVSSHRSCAPVPKQSLNPLWKFVGWLMCFLYIWVGFVVFWMWSDEYCAGQSSLLSAGRSPAHTAKETAGLCSQCTLLAYVQLHTHQEFPLACFPAKPSLYCIFLPQCQTGLLFFPVSGGSYSIWTQVPDLPLPSWGPVFILSKVPLVSEQPWMQPVRCCEHLWAEFSWDTEFSWVIFHCWASPPTLPLSAEA